ncbi:MAG: choice-of-anchor R domain-containing protein [Pseudanabaenaceae cyanobacterium bins.68]|nr:choice-of-anchor R domain-containing protein [Pseudanabaenaceae cyanobacterium bins.68]
MQHSSAGIAIATLVQFIAPIASYGAVLLGNYPPVNSFGVPPSFNGQRQKAISFTVPAPGYTLDSVVLRLSNFDLETETALLQVFADPLLTSTNPNQATLQPVGFETPVAEGPGIDGISIDSFTFLPTSSFVFGADTRYWLLVSAANGSEFEWRADNPPTNVPTGIASFNGWSGSLDGGTTYASSPSSNLLQINATPVPFEFSPALGLGALLSALTIFKLGKPKIW